MHDELTTQQIAKIMLTKGTPEQQAAALAYCKLGPCPRCFGIEKPCRCELLSKIEELKDFAIWMTGCGYDFCQHEYFIKRRDALLKA